MNMISFFFKWLSTKYDPLRAAHQTEEGDFLNTRIVETTRRRFFEILFQERQIQSLSDSHASTCFSRHTKPDCGHLKLWLSSSQNFAASKPASSLFCGTWGQTEELHWNYFVANVRYFTFNIFINPFTGLFEQCTWINGNCSGLISLFVLLCHNESVSLKLRTLVEDRLSQLEFVLLCCGKILQEKSWIWNCRCLL